MKSFFLLRGSPKQLLKIRLILLSIFTTAFVNAQSFQGRVFNEDTPLEGIMFFNKQSQEATYSDKMGDFSIDARKGDTVRISSNYYQEKLVVISTKELERAVVIALKSNDIDLEEVVVTKSLEPKKFNMITYSGNLNKDIKEDIKNNPWKYSKPTTYGIDLAAIAKFIISLFKGDKKSSKSPREVPVSFRHLDSLFVHSEQFNNAFLSETLNIHPDEKQLYFYYLETKKLDIEIFEKEKELDLLETLLVTAGEFNALKNTNEFTER